MRNWTEKEQPEEDTLQSLKKDLKMANPKKLKSFLDLTLTYSMIHFS